MGRVRQERFLLTPGHGFEVTSPSACLDPATANVSSVIDLCEVVSSWEEPVILNVQQTAFYRVNYDTRGWDLLTRSLQTDHTSIHRTHRA